MNCGYHCSVICKHLKISNNLNSQNYKNESIKCDNHLLKNVSSMSTPCQARDRCQYVSRCVPALSALTKSRRNYLGQERWEVETYPTQVNNKGNETGFIEEAVREGFSMKVLF